jgi:hypothetical protein
VGAGHVADRVDQRRDHQRRGDRPSRGGDLSAADPRHHVRAGGDEDESERSEGFGGQPARPVGLAQLVAVVACTGHADDARKIERRDAPERVRRAFHDRGNA